MIVMVMAMVTGMKGIGVEITMMSIFTKVITATTHTKMAGEMVMVTLVSGSALTYKTDSQLLKQRAHRLSPFLFCPI